MESIILEPWRTNCRVTRSLVAALPAEIWGANIPGMPRKTIRMLAAHLHNSRSRWLRTLGGPLGISRPPLVNVHSVTQRALLAALEKSDGGIEALLHGGIECGGRVPSSPAYTWRNLPLDVGHVLSYFVAHEAHHRGQLLLVARQLGAPVPREVTDRLWWWQPEKTRRKRLDSSNDH